MSDVPYHWLRFCLNNNNITHKIGGILMNARVRDDCDLQIVPLSSSYESIEIQHYKVRLYIILHSIVPVIHFEKLHILSEKKSFCVLMK